MAIPRIEHVNVTVSDPERTARLMQALFGWRIRWQGPARDGGRTIHVGSDHHYIALYTGRGVTYGADDFAKGQPPTISVSKSTISPAPRPGSLPPA